MHSTHIDSLWSGVMLPCMASILLVLSVIIVPVTLKSSLENIRKIGAYLALLLLFGFGTIRGGAVCMGRSKEGVLHGVPGVNPHLQAKRTFVLELF